MWWVDWHHGFRLGTPHVSDQALATDRACSEQRPAAGQPPATTCVPSAGPSAPQTAAITPQLHVINVLVDTSGRSRRHLAGPRQSGCNVDPCPGPPCCSHSTGHNLPPKSYPRHGHSSNTSLRMRRTHPPLAAARAAAAVAALLALLFAGAATAAEGPPAATAAAAGKPNVAEALSCEPCGA